MRRIVLLAVAMGAMLLLVSGVALGAYRAGTDRAETLYGTLKADTIYAFGGHDKVFGFDGDDGLRGGAGNDLINAGFGNDVVAGGSGADAIRVGTDEAVDFVDCGPGYDRVYLDDKDRYSTNCEILTPID